MDKVQIMGTLDIRAAAFDKVVDLRQASVGVLRDGRDDWPKQLRLDDFTYEAWDEAGGKFAERKSAWFIDWIERSEGHHPKAYEQCAGVLEAAGYDAMANDIRFACEKKRLELVPGFPLRRVRFALEGLLTRLGYKLWLAFLWSIALVVVGSIMFACTGQATGQAIQNGCTPSNTALTASCLW